MTKPIRFRSLHVKLLLVMLAGLLTGLGTYFLSNAVGSWLIQECYLSEQAVHSRNFATISEFQQYINDNHLSSHDTDSIARWTISKKDIYLLFYQNRHLAMEAGWWGIDDSSTLAMDELSEGTTLTLYPVSFRDGVFQTVIYDFSETRLYTLCTIVAVGMAFAVFAFLMLLYNRQITRAVVSVSQEIQQIGRGNLQFKMAAHGNDELARLVSSVDAMRLSLLRKTQEEKEALEKNSELITAMSHDIRNPLTALMGYLDLAKSGQYRTEDELLQYIGAGYAKAEQIRKLTDELFRYSLVFGGKELPLEMQRYDARLLFEQLLGEQCAALLQYGFRFQTQLDAQPCHIRADVVCLRRVLDNLFDNLRKYADSAKPVELALRTEGTQLCISIRNAAAPEPAVAESNHIGLRTCERIVQQMGGSFLKYERDGLFTAELLFPCVEAEKPEKS